MTFLLAGKQYVIAGAGDTLYAFHASALGR